MANPGMKIIQSKPRPKPEPEPNLPDGWRISEEAAKTAVAEVVPPQAPTVTSKGLFPAGNCFLNAVVDFFSSLTSFKERLTKLIEYCDNIKITVCGLAQDENLVAPSPFCNSESCATCWLASCVRRLQNSPAGVVSLIELHKEILKKLPVQLAEGPQELHDFVQTLLQKLPEKVVKPLFGFQLSRQVKCATCSQSWPQHEQVVCLTLDMNPQEDIAGDIDFYFQRRSPEEFSTEPACDNCPSAPPASPQRASVRFLNLPKFLCLKLNPTGSSPPDKKYSNSSYLIQTLQMDKYLERTSDKDTNYRLLSVIYCKAVGNDRLFLTRFRRSDDITVEAMDEKVTTVSSLHVPDATPCFIVYERIETVDTSASGTSQHEPEIPSLYYRLLEMCQQILQIQETTGSNADLRQQIADILKRMPRIIQRIFLDLQNVSPRRRNTLKRRREDSPVSKAAQKESLRNHLRDHFTDIFSLMANKTHSDEKILELVKTAAAQVTDTYSPQDMTSSEKAEMTVQIFNVFVMKNPDCPTLESFKQASNGKWKQVAEKVFPNTKDRKEIARRANNFISSARDGTLGVYGDVLVSVHQQFCHKCRT